MISTLFILLLSTLLPDPQTPNYYPGLTTAREASKKEQKEMVIFFSEKACNSCEAAWAAFTKDAKATQQYISTRMDVHDFDGGIFFDLLDLHSTPSWVIMNPNGTEKERWEGGWKDAGGNPKLYNKEAVSHTEKPSSPAVPKPSTTDKSPTDTKITHSTPLKQDVQINAGTKQGYFLQAGYFGSEANANKLIADLKLKGFNDFVIETEVKDGSSFYRVVSKMFANEPLALTEQQRLNAGNVKTSLKTR